MMTAENKVRNMHNLTLVNSPTRVCSPSYVALAAYKSVNREPTMAADVIHRLRIVKKLTANMDKNHFFLNSKLVINSKLPTRKPKGVIYDNKE